MIGVRGAAGTGSIRWISNDLDTNGRLRACQRLKPKHELGQRLYQTTLKQTDTNYYVIGCP